MKKIAVIVFALLFLYGCMSLDKAPYDSVAQGNFWKTENDARQAMMGVYAQMKDQGAFGYMPLWDTYSDIGHGPGSPLEVGTYTAKEDFLVSNWKDTWTGVHRANTVLKNVAGMSIEAAVKNPILGEAHFMRALYYFHLVDFFGAVPGRGENSGLGPAVAPEVHSSGSDGLCGIQASEQN